MSTSPAGTATRTLRVAFIGQPNTGKSSLFNRLTGLRQHVGNYAGVTVERKEGRCRLGDEEVLLIDLPGTYSLNALSPDERITVRALAGHPDIGPRPDVIVCVAAAAHLQRSLLPAYQAAPLGIPMVIAANFMDEARSQKLEIDFATLEQRLGVPVVATAAHRGEGVEALKRAIRHAFQERRTLHPPDWPEAVRRALGMLHPHATGAGRTEPCAFTAQRLLFDTSGHAVGALTGDAAARARLLEDARAQVQRGGHHPATAEPVLLFAHIRGVLDGCVRQTETLADQWSHRFDGLLAHPVLGLGVFAAVMFAVFQAVYSGSAPFMEGIEAATAGLQQAVSPLLASTPMLQSLVGDGIIAGLGSVLVFLPQILILTALIAFLEDCGYLARAAFLVDRVFSGIGLNGKSFVPLMSSHACAIPGILATRSIEDPKTRATTIFIAPFMSCSARLPVYALLIGAFIEPRYGSTVAAACLFAAHLVGPFAALPIAWLLQRKILRAPSPPFLLELPPYRLPALRDLLWRVGQRGQRFLSDAGTVIFCITILIWALLYFPRPGSVAQSTREAFIASALAAEPTPRATIEQALNDPEDPRAAALENATAAAYVEQSFLGRAGKAVQPLFAPAGFDWKITVGVLASFPAREVIISTLGVIYNLGGGQDEASGDLRSRLHHETWASGPRAGQPVYTVPTAAALMVFFALCMQCGATLAIMRAEAGWRWAAAGFAVMTTLAWLGAVAAYQILTTLGL